MRVSVRFLGSVNEVVGKKEEDVEIEKGATLKDLVDLLVAKHGLSFRDSIEDKDLSIPKVAYTVNGTSIFALEGMKTKLPDGAKVTIIPQYAGG